MENVYVIYVVPNLQIPIIVHFLNLGFSPVAKLHRNSSRYTFNAAVVEFFSINLFLLSNLILHIL